LRRSVVVMHRTITARRFPTRRFYHVTRYCLPGPRTCRRHQRRKHRRKQGGNCRDGQNAPHGTAQTISRFSKLKQ
jgi:hypothetical protein